MGETAIPRLEVGALRLRVVTAKEFADEGRLADGYDCLLAGSQQARQAAEQGAPWAAELVLRYLQAIDEYVDRYGVRFRAGMQGEDG